MSNIDPLFAAALAPFVPPISDAVPDKFNAPSMPSNVGLPCVYCGGPNYRLTKWCSDRCVIADNE